MKSKKSQRFARRRESKYSVESLVLLVSSVCPNDWNCQIDLTYLKHVGGLVPQVVQQLLARDTSKYL